MSGGEWTIDGIAHALSVPEQRMKFLRDINMTPLTELPAVLDRWVRHVTALEAARPRIEALRGQFQETGQLPAEFEETEESVAAFDELRERTLAATPERGAA
ncbi:hypothetical protein HUT19_42135 (plasmid) [Streptomyces sp. NA02950]|uniref:hypothetical protein n=1 Tax=Streptomyces sp. NA02950 TaxID=2742137 RepID=UPI00159064BF|nr:hypothetical protein [Streptomyces sp. NA02950]QKV98318.1 hypothetical protein HUT19_42135 [Streptomyces sp. NA02950]